MVRKFRKLKDDQKGFTLMELILAVAIVGLLLTIAIPIYKNVQSNAKDTIHETNIRIIEGAIQAYLIDCQDNVDHSEFYTTINKDHPLIREEFLKKVPISPNNKLYEINNTGSVTEGDVSPDPPEPVE